LIEAAVVLSLLAGAARVEAEAENKQQMARSPEELVDMISDAAFLPPDAYRARFESESAAHVFPLGLSHLPQPVDPSSDPRRDLTAEEIESYADALVAISLESKADGEILWGRIQGTKYERKALDWVEEKLRSFGFEDVHHIHFPVKYPQWRPTRSELVVTAAPTFGADEVYRVAEAITCFPSALTPEGGVEAELVYVGDGSPAELAGRDITGRIVLLRARGYPSIVMNTIRATFSRVATGRYGRPAGVVVWSDVPGARQVAARVGAVGGGDSLGLAMPWTSIGDDEGFYLRKLLDRASPQAPVKVRLDVQGRMESGEERMSGTVYGVLPGRSGDFIVVSAHVDGYFYALHDNGATAAMNLALARRYAQIPAAARPHGLVFLFTGDHEVPGVAGGAIEFIERNRKLVEEHLMLVLRPEKVGLMRPLEEGIIVGRSNVAEPMMLLVTNRSPLLIDVFKRAIRSYAIPTGDLLLIDPAGDESAFHPPYNDLGAISAGWILSGRTYHSTADVDRGLVSYAEVEKMARAHAFVIDELAARSRADLREGGSAPPEKSIYQSDLFKLFFGNF
jgi:hypothetical protein